MDKCIEETGKALIHNNEDIVKYLCNIEEERNNLDMIIQKQYQERKRIETEIEKYTYKLCLINKSLSMRIKAKNNYDRTIDEIRSHYEKLVDNSNTLRQIVQKTQQDLDDIMNKKIGTNAGPNGEEIRMLYVKPNENGESEECPCAYIVEAPTKEYGAPKEPPPPLPTRHSSQDTQDGTYDFPEPDAPFQSEPENLQPTDLYQSQSEEQHEMESDCMKNFNPETRNKSMSEEEMEIEISSVTAEKELPREHTSIEIESSLDDTYKSINSVRSTTPTIASVEKPGGPLPDLPVGTDADNMLFSRLRHSLNKMTENVKTRVESRIAPAKSKMTSSNEAHESISLESNTYKPGKMEKRSVTDVLKATTGHT